MALGSITEFVTRLFVYTIALITVYIIIRVSIVNGVLRAIKSRSVWSSRGSIESLPVANVQRLDRNEVSSCEVHSPKRWNSPFRATSTQASSLP